MISRRNLLGFLAGAPATVIASGSTSPAHVVDSLYVDVDVQEIIAAFTVGVLSPGEARTAMDIETAMGVDGILG